MSFDPEHEGVAQPVYYNGIPVLSASEADAVRAELMFDEDGSVIERGRRAIASLGWQEASEIDCQRYGQEASTSASDEQKEEFCVGLSVGYEFTLGVLAHVYDSRGVAANEALLLTPDYITFFAMVRSNELPIDPTSNWAFIVEDPGSSDLLFEHTGDMLMDNQNLDRLVQEQERHIGEQLSGKESVEYHLAGFTHGVTSVIGFLVMMKEKAELDIMDKMFGGDS